MTIESFDTEGVLIIANTTKCKNYYQDKEFNYSYPDGLSELLKKGIVHIITTEETVENLNFVFSESEINQNNWEYNESYNYLDIEEGDEVRLISHATFTQMCDSYKGDFDAKIESSLKTRNLINPENPIVKEALLDECPEVKLPNGLWKVNVYSNTVAGEFFLPEFTYLFEKIDAIDTAGVTLEPLEIEG
jgi:hypothetical protein